MNKSLTLILLVFVAFAMKAQTTITMEQKGNVYYIPGKVNGLPLKFIFDTGASDVYISLTEALFMLKNGYLNDEDFGETSYAQVADGSIVEKMEITLREIEIGGIILRNIKASISNSLDAPILLGQSAIQKLGPIQLNGNKLTITNGTSATSVEDVFQLYRKAYQEAEAGAFDESIKHSKEALSICTDKTLRAALFDNLAYCYYNSGRKAEAIETLNQALGEDYMSEQPGYNLGVYYYETGDIDKALRAFSLFVKRHPNAKDKNALMASYAYLGDCYAKKGEVKNAEDAYNKSLQVQKNTSAALGLADLYARSNRYSDAIPLYEYAVVFEPNRLSNIKRYNQLGFCYVHTGQDVKAKEAYERCVQAFRANHDLISSSIQSEDPEMASIGFEFSFYGFDAELWIARLTKNPAEAIRQYEKIYDIPSVSENFIDVDYMTWSEAYLANGKTPRAVQKAKEVLEKGLKAQPDNPELLFGISLLEDSKSIEHLNHLLKILEYEYTYTPRMFDYATVYNNIAWHYALNGNYSDALPYSEASIKMNSDHDYSWDTLGEIYYNLGRYQDCVNAMNHVMSSGDRDMVKHALELRGQSYIKLGKNREGKKDLEESRKL